MKNIFRVKTFVIGGIILFTSLTVWFFADAAYEYDQMNNQGDSEATYAQVESNKAEEMQYKEDDDEYLENMVFNDDEVDTIAAASENESEDQVAMESSSVSGQLNSFVSSDINQLTVSELAKYNGMNGQPAYIAVDGIIYDMTSVSSWNNGSHQGYQAGQDLTQAFSQSPHSQSVLAAGKVIGSLVSNVASNQSSVNSNTALSQPQTITQNEPETTSVPKTTSELVTITDTLIPSSSTWSLDLLSIYNGKNGQPAYIVVNQTIYDVTNISAWSSGTHKGLTAGKDLTQAFASSPHSMSVLNGAPVIGKLGDIVQSSRLIPATTNSLIPTTTISNNYIGEEEDEDEDEYEDENEYEHEDEEEHEDEHEEDDD